MNGHELVGIDAGGKLCECGDYGNRLEHLGDLALRSFGIYPPPLRKPRQPRRIEWHSGPSNAIDRLMDYGATDDEIQSRLGVAGALVRERRELWCAALELTAS